MRKKTKLRIRIKPIKMNVHPTFFALAERYRKDLEQRGLKGSQLNITQIMAKRLSRRRRLL